MTVFPWCSVALVAGLLFSYGITRCKCFEERSDIIRKSSLAADPTRARGGNVPSPESLDEYLTMNPIQPGNLSAMFSVPGRETDRARTERREVIIRRLLGIIHHQKRVVDPRKNGNPKRFPRSTSDVLSAHQGSAVKQEMFGTNSRSSSDQSAVNTNECPLNCRCIISGAIRDTEITSIDRSNSNLTQIPLLPPTAVEVKLQENLLEVVPCDSFSRLDMSRNPMLTSRALCSLNISGPLERLNLSDSSLNNHSLPDGVFDNLLQLQSLDLSKNELSEIRHKLFQRLGQLRSLNLHHNQISRTTNNTFGSLLSLEIPSLQGNKLRYMPGTFEPLAFSGLHSLHTLHLHGNEPVDVTVSYTDQALSWLPWLSELRLDGHAQSPLGPGFSALKTLTHLVFSKLPTADKDAFCRLGDGSFPPKMFANLATLEPLHLGLSNCELKDIPPAVFSYLSTLYSLDLSINSEHGFSGFKNLSQFFQNTSLELLNLSKIAHGKRYYKPTAIQSTHFRYLRRTRLRVLVLEENHLYHISPDAVAYLPASLEYISVANNYLVNQYLWYGLVRLFNMKKIQVSNQIVYKPKCYIENSSKISQSYLNSQNQTDLMNTAPDKAFTTDMLHKENEAQNVPHPEADTYYWLANVTSSWCPRNDLCDTLESLYGSQLSDQYKYHPFCFPLPMNLDNLYLNDIKVYFDVPTSKVMNSKVLKPLEYSKNDMKCIGGPFLGMPALELLDLSKNYCLHLDPITFLHLTSLKTLLLHDNVLGQSLADDVQENTLIYLADLETLNLSSSNLAIDSFTSRLINTSQLRTLSLSVKIPERLSEQTLNELIYIKANNANFTALIRNNQFICDCADFDFLCLLVNQPEIFVDVDSFRCKLVNGSDLVYADLERFLPELELHCISENLFMGVACIFFLLLGTLAVVSLYHYKRWQWAYLFYVGKSRMHFGARLINATRTAHVFVTYDQDDLTYRRLVHSILLPRLRQVGITYILGETDFSAGPLCPSIAGAVTNSSKTLVLLSSGIFENHHRELEVNLAIMHELQLRSPVLVPVLMLKQEVYRRATREHRPSLTASERISNSPESAHDWNESTPTEREHLLLRHLPPQGLPHAEGRRCPISLEEDREGCDFENDDDVDYQEGVLELLENFPQEISAFLEGQQHRCLIYDGDSSRFWEELVQALWEDC